MLPCWGSWDVVVLLHSFENCMVSEQVPAAVHHSRLCMMHPDISEWFPVIKYTYDTHAESHYTHSSGGSRDFFFHLFFLVESEQRTFPAKFQHWKEKVSVRACLLSHSICLHPSKQQAKMCQHKHTCTKKSLCCFGHLRELGSLASSLTRPRGTGGVFLF